MADRFGLSKNSLQYLIQQLAKFAEIEKVVVFGSRAMGNYKDGSDIDLALFGERVTFDTISQLKSLLEDQGPLPYLFDIVHYDSITDEAFKKHIDEFGVELAIDKTS